QYLLFLNSDTELIELSSFRKMLDCFKTKNVGVVGARLLLENNTIQHAGLAFDSKQMNYTHRYYGKDMNDPVVCVNEVVDVITGACFLTSRDLWNKLGGFDKIYSPGYFEDTDYCLRAKELGYSTIYCGEAILYHYQSKSFSGGPTKEHFGRNHEIFKQRWVRTGKIVKYPKIAACYITKDSEEFIAYSIKSIYDMVVKIIVVDNSSKDKTLEILKNIQFNDPQNKITVISRGFANKTEQRNVYCQMLDGMDYAWVVDSDEVWSGEDLRKVEHLVFANPQIPSFCFNFIDFWKDLANVSKGIWETFVGRKSLINLNICGKIKYNIHTLPILESNEEIPSVFAKDIYFH
ncbi:MAG: glycosyltransferase family 2 protein, partial [DPANN group archaeon]|nr:glycosyltransferase family 2 protein [DPANN group archaeon]